MRYRITFLTFLVLVFGLSIVSAQTGTPVKSISGGVLNGKALSLPKPAYPAAARAVGASGTVNVQVDIDGEGKVVAATAVSGHPLLRQAAAEAASAAKFTPTLLSGQPVRVSGILVYNFVGTAGWLSEGVSFGIAETRGIKAQINLPDEFSSEQQQLNTIAKLPAEEQKSQLLSTVSIIKSKLNAADLWRFEFGLAKGGIYGNLDNDEALLSNLAKFKELAINKPEGIQEYEINQAAELAKFADKGKLTVEDKQAIFSYLK